MSSLSPTAVHLAEEVSRRLRRRAAGGGWREPSVYFEPGEPRPADPAYFERLDRINETFDSWLDPGEVAAPEPGAVERQGDVLRFPSPVPSGRPEVDRVALRLLANPAGAPEVGVLFHHWWGMSGWLAAGFLLRPLVRRFRVAAMVAPHHLMRQADGARSGDGFINPNPRCIFEGFRQWLADHLACLELLRRDRGWARVVVVGYSIGAYGALLHRLIRPALPTVAICSTNCYPRGVLEGFHTRELGRRVLEAGFTREGFQRATRSIHLARWASRIGGERLTWIYARHDEIEPADSLREAREALAPERVVELGGGHSTALLLHRRTIVAEIVQRVERTVTTL